MEALLFYKVGQVVLKREANWSIAYKVGQYALRATENLSRRIPEKLNFCYNCKTEEVTHSPQTYSHHLQA